jgi:hypothetical protein
MRVGFLMLLTTLGLAACGSDDKPIIVNTPPAQGTVVVPAQPAAPPSSSTVIIPAH